MDAERLSELESARVAFERGEQAHTEHAVARRAAFGHYQRALVLLRSGAPLVREEDEKAGLEFLLEVPPDGLDDAALDEGVNRLRGETNALLLEREGLEVRRKSRGWQQPLELVVPGLVAIIVSVAGYVLAQRALEPVDLAEGKPWAASSAWAICTPQAGRCGPVTSRILFHTKDDDSPWFRIDLGVPTTLSGATIINRSDDAPERAVPLLIEVGDDGVTYREVARRESQFSIWRASFPSVSARFVRVRVPRKTWLHLEAVKLHP